MAQTWLNNDGLYIKFGNKRGDAGIAGSFAAPANGAQTVVEFDITLSSLTSSAAVIDDNVVLPQNARIEKVELLPIEAADSASDTAALNIGLIRTDRSTSYDDDGLVDAAAQTEIDTVVEVATYTVGDAGSAGALVGTVLAHNGLVTADYDTEAFTQGKVKVKIYFTVAANRSAPWTA